MCPSGPATVACRTALCTGGLQDSALAQPPHALSLNHRPAPAVPQVTFGEFPAFVTLASLLLEYALGMAATARGFSLYLNSLLDLSPGTLIVNINNGAHTLDPMVGGAGRGGRVHLVACLLRLQVLVLGLDG